MSVSIVQRITVLMRSLYQVRREGGDPNTDQVDYDNILHQQRLPALPKSDDDTPPDADENEASEELSQMSSVEILNKAMDQVLNAAVDVGDYDDESETLTYHGEQLDQAHHAMAIVRNRLAQESAGR